MKKVLWAVIILVILWIWTWFVSQKTNWINLNLIKWLTQRTTLANPASVNCKEKNWTLEIVSDTSWWQLWLCHLSDGNICEEWAYYRWECPKKGINDNEIIQWAIYIWDYNNQKIMYSKNTNNFEQVRNLVDWRWVNDGIFWINTTWYTKIENLTKIYQPYYKDTINNENLVSIKESNNKIYFSTVKSISNSNNTLIETTYIKEYNLSDGVLKDDFSVQKTWTLAIENINKPYIILVDYPCYACELSIEPLSSIILNTTNSKTLDIWMVWDIQLDITNNIVKFRKYQKTYEPCDEINEPMYCEKWKREKYQTIWNLITQTLP